MIDARYWLRWDDIRDWVPAVREVSYRGNECATVLQLVIRDGMSYEAAGREMKIGAATVKKVFTHACTLILLAMFGRIPERAYGRYSS